MKKQGKHHYIPRFLIKGFTDSKGEVWVYDKKYDQIKKNPVGPGGIFFEWGRNNLELNGITSSVIETEWFMFLDNFCKTVIKEFQEAKNTELLHSYDNVSKMQYFLLHLYWRLPKTDFAFDNLIKKSKINFKNKISSQKESDKELESKLTAEKNFKKIEKVIVPNLIIKELKNYKLPKRFCSKLIDKNNDIFLLGDYPMLFRKEPESFDDIISRDYILPISSKRIYSISQNNCLEFDFSKATTLNTLIIHQSQRFVCSPDKVFLEKSVEYYKKQLGNLPHLYLREKVFEN